MNIDLIVGQTPKRYLDLLFSLQGTVQDTMKDAVIAYLVDGCSQSLIASTYNIDQSSLSRKVKGLRDTHDKALKTATMQSSYTKDAKAGSYSKNYLDSLFHFLKVRKANVRDAAYETLCNGSTQIASAQKFGLDTAAFSRTINKLKNLNNIIFQINEVLSALNQVNKESLLDALNSKITALEASAHELYDRGSIQSERLKNQILGLKLAIDEINSTEHTSVNRCGFIKGVSN